MTGAFSDFADQGLLIPVEMAVFFVLFAMGRRRDALAWGAAMVAGSFLILCLKLWFERCGVPSHRILYSPSGHTMTGTMVYGGLLAIFCRNTLLFAAGAVLVSAAFALSRVMLGVHTQAEVLLAGILGLGVVAGLRLSLSGERRAGGKVLPVTLVSVCVIGFLLHGYRLGIEQRIQVFAKAQFGHLFCSARS